MGSVLLFGSADCAACKKAAAELSTVNGYNYIDVHKQGALASSYGVIGLPTIVVLEDGKVVEKFTAYSPKIVARVKELAAGQ